MTSMLEWTGAFLGLIGAGLLALNMRASGAGWIFFLLSNVAWIAFGVQTGAYGLVAMQIGFTATSLIGIWKWLLQRP